MPDADLESAVQPEQPVAAQSPVAAPVPAPGGPVAQVLSLQRSAGNAAVSRWLAGRRAAGAGPRAVSRYEAGEHAQFGGDRTVMVNGVPISNGNIIAMADFFRTPEDMNSADPEVLKKLDAAITLDRQARTGGVGPDGQPLKPPSNDDIQKITEPLGEGNTYMDLNKSNQAHFAPPKDGPDPEGKDHKSAFAKFHRQALQEAHAASPPESREAPGGTPPASTSSPPVSTPPAPAPPAVTASSSTGPGRVPEKAVATNAFAAHFLTDAFAAGHLINKGEVMKQAQESWDKMPNTGGKVLQQNKFTDEVSKRVLEEPTVKAKMAGMEMINLRALAVGAGIGAGVGLIMGIVTANPLVGLAGVIGGAALGGAIAYTLAGYEDVQPERLSELLNVTSRLQPGTFFNIFARMVHDKLNREGVEVSNDKGETWQLSGDETLNAESLAHGREAVAEADKNLEEAANSGEDPPFDEMIERVWKHVAHPTEKGQKFIDDTRAELTDGSNEASIQEAVNLTVKEIDTAIGEMVKMHILRPKGGAPPAPSGAGGAPAAIGAPPAAGDGGAPSANGVPAGDRQPVPVP